MAGVLKGYWILGIVLGSLTGYGQEGESAEWSVEEVTDRFQEVFFEALKQKGIENYDRAETLLLDARGIDPTNPVVDFELARVLLLERKLPEAEYYALQALKSRPGNYWFLQTFMEILEKQFKPLDSHREDLPTDLPEFRSNLGRWYLDSGKADLAESQFIGLPDTPELQRLRERASRLKAEAEAPLTPEAREGVPGSAPSRGSIADLETRLESLLGTGEWPSLEKLSAEALETYPLQPYFYYANGVAKLRQGRAAEAVGILEEGESLLLGDTGAGRKIYATLAEAYTALGDMEKANAYLKKLKPGS